MRDAVGKALAIFEAGGELEAVLQEMLAGLERMHPQHRFLAKFQLEPDPDAVISVPIRDANEQILAQVMAFGPEAATLEAHVTLAVALVSVVASRREEARRLDEVRAHSRTIVDMAVDAIVTMDERGSILSVNRATEQLFGYEASELIGQNVKILMPEPYHSEHDGYLARYAETRQARIIGVGRQVTGRRKDGTLFPAHLAVSEVTMDGSRRFTGFLRDISDVLELARQKAHSQVILDMAVDAIITIDDRGLIRSANRATQLLFGYTAGELLGQNVRMLMPEPYRAEHDGYINRYKQTGQARIIGIGRQVTGQRKDGTLFPAHLAVSETILDGERLFTGFVRDISDVVELESEMVRRETEYLEREASVVLEERKFLSRELHDSVSQALFGIVLGTQAALNALEKPERAREALDYVLSLAESGLAEMRALILELRPESLDSEGLLGSLTRQIKALTRRYQLTMNLDLGPEPDLPLTLKHECYRVAMEAMNNVIKHARATTLGLRVQMEGDRLVLEVSDDGVGFEPAEVPVSRVGLQSMRERVAGTGGEMEIATRPGEGTRVRASFPGV